MLDLDNRSVSIVPLNLKQDVREERRAGQLRFGVFTGMKKVCSEPMRIEHCLLLIPVKTPERNCPARLSSRTSCLRLSGTMEDRPII